MPLTRGRGGTPDETGAMYEDPPPPEEEEESSQQQRQHQKHKPKQHRPFKTKKKPSWAS
jgi:hypothetical protein